jgi:predicted enzyme related to lactoylglutathione lyase
MTMPGDLAYFMLTVGDAERAEAFFGGLFGWEFGPGSVPEGRQITNSTPPGGLFATGSPSKPEVWFEVDDIEAALARIRELGGEPGEAEEIASGYMASCRDDQGTPFNVWASRD